MNEGICGKFTQHSLTEIAYIEALFAIFEAMSLTETRLSQLSKILRRNHDGLKWRVQVKRLCSSFRTAGTWLL